LAGYAIECAFKACIAELSRHHQFPLSPGRARDIYCHNFDKLVKAAVLVQAIEDARKADNTLRRYWNGVVKDWSEESRYYRKGDKKKAQSLIEAIADPDHGVLEALQRNNFAFTEAF
jgi:hypothetical protein